MSTYKTASEALEAIIGTAENFMQDWDDDDGMSKADRAEFEAWRGVLNEAIAMARAAIAQEAPRVLITMEGGIVQDVDADGAVVVAVIDFDVDGSDSEQEINDEPARVDLHTFNADAHDAITGNTVRAVFAQFAKVTP